MRFRLSLAAVLVAVLAAFACGGSDDPAAESGGPGGADGGGGADTATEPSTEDSSVNPNPTISSWIGTNVATDLSRVDVTYQLQPFDTPAAQRDASGYPVAGASGRSATDIGFVLPTGTYAIAYKGTGTLAVSGIGALGGAWQSVGDEHRATVQITGTPGAFGNFLNLTITNAPGQTVTSVRLLHPGFSLDSKELFLPKLLDVLAPFRAMRLMDWEETNNSKLESWADRPAATAFGHSSSGEPYEHIVELVNQTGKDCWITIPEHASSDFIARFAEFMAKGLDFGRIQAARDRAGFTTPFELIVEYSNETWNQGFSAYATSLAAANANAARYTGSYAGTYGPTWMKQNADLMKVGQVEADRLVEIGNAFRAAFGAIGRSDAIKPALSGWALGPVYSDVGLELIKKNYGEPKSYVAYVALAPYFATADDTTTGSLGALFPALEKDIADKHAVYQEFAKLVAQYGLKIAAYEGGQGLTGTTNQSIKHLAQHDARMYDAYKSYLALWKQDFGQALFMHYSLAGTPGVPEFVFQYGYWGSLAGVLEDTTACKQALPTLGGTEGIASVVHFCPKYRALAEQVP